MSVEQFLNERWSEEYRILINVLRDKLEEVEITIQECENISLLEIERIERNQVHQVCG